MNQPGEAHRKRFNKWQNLCRPETRFLSSAVDSRLVPILESHEFHRVDVHLRQSDWPVNGSEIELERADQSFIDTITFHFEKYRSPRFQVHASRRALAVPHDFIRSCNLVARGTQYYHFWGKPWWLPTRLWSDKQSIRTTDFVASVVEQLLRYIESDERGTNISRQSTASIKSNR